VQDSRIASTRKRAQHTNCYTAVHL